MAKCGLCKKEMMRASTTSCSQHFIVINGKKYRRNTTYFDNNTRCHDCNIVNKKGNAHHKYCDMERCPIHPDQQNIACNKCEDEEEQPIPSKAKKVLWQPGAQQQGSVNAALQRMLGR